MSKVLSRLLLPALFLSSIAYSQPALADSGQPAEMVTDTAISQIQQSTASAEAADDYWTPERIASAVSADEGESVASSSVDVDATGDLAAVEDPSAALAEPVAPSASAEVSPLAASGTSKTVGKVFFTNASDGGNYYCSASVVNSTAKNMVMTAAHCVHDGPNGTWHKNWVFAPAFSSGTRPYGNWSSAVRAVPTGWVQTRERRYDVAIALVRSTSTTYQNRTIVSVTGGNGLTTGGSKARYYDIFGYPSNRNSGATQQICSGTSYDAGSNRIQINCAWAGGSSGGPWFSSFNNTSKLGYVNGLTSYSNTAHTYIGSPYFASAVVGTLYDNYKNRTT